MVQVMFQKTHEDRIEQIREIATETFKISKGEIKHVEPQT